MYTAMAFVALTMGSLATPPAFHDDYRAAQAQVTVAGKPMAVFVGSGKAGWESVIREGGFDTAVTKLLSEKFVCLYVDSSTPAGKSLASAFQVGDRGVVLSDRTGTKQAYSAAGTVSRSELSRALLAYADQKDAPKATETKGAAAGAAPATIAPGSVMTGPGGPMMTQPTYTGGPGGYGYGGGYGGGCGTCGIGGCATGGCGTGGCAQAGCGNSNGCGQSKGCCFFGGSKCGGHQASCAPAPCGPAPCAQPACGQSKGCCFFGGSKCGGGWGGGCGGGYGGGYGGGCGGCK